MHFSQSDQISIGTLSYLKHLPDPNPITTFLKRDCCEIEYLVKYLFERIAASKKWALFVLINQQIVNAQLKFYNVVPNV